MIKIPQSTIKPFGTLVTMRKLSMSMMSAHIHNEMMKLSELADVQPINIPWGNGFTMRRRYEDEDS